MVNGGNESKSIVAKTLNRRIQYMRVVKAGSRKIEDPLVKLSRVKPGSAKVIRFQGTTYQEALSNKDDATFYMVVKPPTEKTGRVTLVSIDGRSVRECDDDHLVYVHDAVIEVDETAEKI